MTVGVGQRDDRLLGMVLAAGRGERMRPLTDHLPKPALPLVGRPLVHLAVENLQGCGVDEAHANASHLGDRMVEALETIGGTGFNLLIHREDDMLGTAGGLRNALGPSPEAAVLVHNGDVLYRGDDLPALVAAHHEKGALATMGLVRVGERGLPRSVILAGGGHVEEFTRDRRREIEGWTFSGIQVLSPEVFAELPERGCIVADVLARLLDTRRVVGFPLSGLWADIGTMGRYKAFHRRVLEDAALLKAVRPDLAPFRNRDRVVLHPHANVATDARIQGPCIIDVAAEIGADCSLGPGVFVGAGARVRRGSRLQDVVVFPGADIVGEHADVFVVEDAPVSAHPLSGA